MSAARPEFVSGKPPLLPPERAARRLRTFLLAAAAAAAVVLWWTGILGEVIQPDRIRQIIQQTGPWAPVAFVALQIPLNLVFLAGAPVWISATLWPLPLAIAYSVAGTVIASTSTYLLARRLGDRWAAIGIPRRLQRLERRIDGKPVRTVAALRLLLWINPGVDLLMAASNVRLRHYAVGTFVGMLLPTGLRVFIGDVGIDALSDLASGDEPATWPWLLTAAVVVGLIALARHRRQRLAGGARSPTWAKTPTWSPESEGGRKLPNPTDAAQAAGSASRASVP